MFLWSKSCWILLVCNVCCFMNNLVCWRDSVTKLLWSSTSHKRLDFDTPLSSITTLIPQSPLPSRPHSWLPCMNRPYFILGSSHFLSPPSFSPPLIPLLLCLYNCTKSSYTGFGTCDNAYDVMLGLHHNAVSPAALFFAAPDDKDYLNFSHDDIFSSTFLFSNL